jgi:lauroyl/myristoyl acyltransferase
LALRTGVPLLTSFMQRLPDNRTLVHFDPPLAFARTADLQADVRAATAQIAAIMARYIRHDPAQWLVAERVWEQNQGPRTKDERARTNEQG